MSADLMSQKAQLLGAFERDNTINWKLVRATTDYQQGSITDLQIIFNDVDGHSSIVFSDHRIQFNMSDIRKGAVFLRVDIDLSDTEYDQFKQELLHWIKTLS